MWQSSDCPQCPLSCSLIYLLIFIIFHFLMCFIPKGLGLLFNFTCPAVSLSQLPLAYLAPLLIACWSQVQQGIWFHGDSQPCQDGCSIIRIIPFLSSPVRIHLKSSALPLSLQLGQISFSSVLCCIWVYIWHSSPDHLSQAVSVSLVEAWPCLAVTL